MWRSIAVIVLWGIWFQTNAQELVLKVENIKSNDGQLIVSLFTNSQDFLKKPAYEKYVNISSTNHMKLVLTDVPSGEYALCIIHDKNGNGDIDTNFLKIPKEAYGFSHNPKSRFGPPEFEKVKFAFYKNTELTVQLN